MRRRLIAFLVVALLLPAASPRPSSPPGDARRTAGAPCDESPALAAPGDLLAAPVGPKTSPGPVPLGAIAPPSPLLAPPTSDATLPIGVDWLPVGSARRHPWLQRFCC